MTTVALRRHLVVAYVLLGTSFAQGGGHQNVPITAVSGPSWIAHLHRPFDETSMGKTGRLGPPVVEASARYLEAGSRQSISDRVTLTGSDLYRLNCRGCHGETGAGAPPEINSVINPVRATSVAAVLERMKSTGMEMSRADAAKLAAQSRAALLTRLHSGGQDMPAFPHLGDTEVRVLIGYLNQLADVPGAYSDRENRERTINASRLRVGELIVKSTCHTCHGATGNNPSAKQIADGAIPPLSTLTLRTNRDELIRKVTEGAPISMGSPPILCRGRMPVFFYLSEDEAGDIYDYLSSYPPREEDEAAMPLVASSGSWPRASSPPSVVPMAMTDDPPAVHPRTDQLEDSIVLPVAVLLVFALITIGLAFSVREIQKLALQELPEADASVVDRISEVVHHNLVA